MNIAATQPLPLTDRLDVAWLGVITLERTLTVVLAGDPRAPTLWCTIDAEATVVTGPARHHHIRPLHTLGLACSLYPHTRVLSIWPRDPDRAAAARWGLGVRRMRIARTAWDLVAAAAKASNTAGAA